MAIVTATTARLVRLSTFLVFSLPSYSGGGLTFFLRIF